MTDLTLFGFDSQNNTFRGVSDGDRAICDGALSTPGLTCFQYLTGLTQSLSAGVPLDTVVGSLFQVTAYASGHPKFVSVWECVDLNALLPDEANAGDITGAANGSLYILRSDPEYWRFEYSGEGSVDTSTGDIRALRADLASGEARIGKTYSVPYLTGASDSLAAKIPGGLFVGDFVAVTAYSASSPAYPATWQCMDDDATLPGGAVAGDVTGTAMGVLYLDNGVSGYYVFEFVGDKHVYAYGAHHGGDCSANIQAAIHAAESLIATNAALIESGVEVIFPGGNGGFECLDVKVTKSGVGLVGPAGCVTLSGDGIVLDLGDYTHTSRLRNVALRNILVRTPSNANMSAGIKLYRLIDPKLNNVNVINFYVGIDCIRVGQMDFGRGVRVYNPNRTANALAGIRLRGLDETLLTGETYAPGGGIHVDGLEIDGDSPSAYTQAGILVNAVDGLYIGTFHCFGCQYDVEIAPDGSPENHVITDIMGAVAYLDRPSDTTPALSGCLKIGGTVQRTITMADGSVQESVYQGLRFHNWFLRASETSDNALLMLVLDADDWAANASRKLRDIKFVGGAMRQARRSGAAIRGSSAGYVEAYGVLFDGVEFADNNAGGTAAAGAIECEAESVQVVNCNFGPNKIAAARDVSINLSSPDDSISPSAIIAVNNFDDSNSTNRDPVLVVRPPGSSVSMFGNSRKGAGTRIDDTFPGTTTDDAPLVLWSLAIPSSGQVGAINIRTIGSSSTGTETAMYEHRVQFRRISSGSTALPVNTVVESADNITDSNFPVIVGLLAGAPFPTSAAVTAGQQYISSGNLYLVLDAGTTDLVAPTFTSGVQMSGTAKIGYVAPANVNSLSVVVSGSATTTIEWVTKIDMLAKP
jgi:hypothetical protein